MQKISTLLIVTLLSCSPYRMVQTELYCGQSKLDGSTVTEAEWNAFVEKYVSRVFKNGSTVINAGGNWYDTAAHKLIVEPTKIITSLNKMTPYLTKQVDSLAYWYKTLHNQQSVFRVDKKIKGRLL